MKNIIFIIIIIALLGVGGYWYTENPHQMNEQHYVSEVPVQVATASEQSIPDTIQTIGSLSAVQQANISSEVAGRVQTILFTPGRFVKQGQALIQLDNRINRIHLAAANAKLKLDQSNYQRYKQLTKEGAGAKQALEQARTNYQQSLTQVNAMKNALAETTIKAPFSGYIGPKNVSVGDYIEPGQTLTILVNRAKLQANYQFAEKYLLDLKMGQAVVIKVHGVKPLFNGKVTYVAPNVDMTTHSVALQALINNRDNQLAPGLFVKVKQTIRHQRKSVVIPQQALIPMINGSQVFVVRDQKAWAVSVKTGLTLGANVQIIKGIKAGDVVVTAGQSALKTGDQVKVVKG